MHSPCRLTMLGGLLSLAILAGCDGNSVGSSGDLQANIDRYRSQGDYKSAAIEVKNALKLQPDDTELRLMLGQLQVRLGDFSGAEKELKRALSLGASLESVAPALATSYFRRGNWQALIDDIPAESVPAGTRTWIAIQLQRAVAYAQLGDVPAAEQTYEDVLEANPGHGGALLGLGTLALAKGELEEADSLLESAMKAAPADPAVWLQIGKLRYQQHRYDDAILSFKRALKRSETPQDVRIGMAWAYMAKGRFDLVRKQAQFVRKSDPAHPEANYLLAALAFKDGENDKAGDYLDNFSSESDGNLSRTVLLSAANHQALGNYAQAEGLLRDFLAENPNFLPAQTILAQVLQAQGRTKVAFEGLQSVARKTGGEEKVALDLAKLALKANKPNEAKAYLAAAIAAGEARPEVLAAKEKLDAGFMHRASALLENLDEQVDDQASQTAATIESDPIDSQRLSEAAMVLKQGDLARSEALAKALVKDYPESVEALNLLGSAQAGQDRFPEARTSFSRAAALRPNYPRAIRNLFLLELGLKNYEAAGDLVDRELKKFPLDADLLVSRARVAMLLGNTNESIGYLTKALEVNPAAVSPRINLARLYLAEGERSQAAKVLEKAYRTNPGNTQVLALMGQIAEANGLQNEAASYYRQQIEADPAAASGYERLAVVLIAKGEIREARGVLEDWLERQPGNAGAAAALVNLRLRDGDIGSAMQVAKDLQQAAPSSVAGFVLEADVWSADGEYAKAEGLYEVAFQREPSLAVAKALYAARLRAGNSATAMAPLQQWVRANPLDSGARIALANAWLRAGENNKAVGELKAVLETQPTNTVALNNLAHASLLTGEKKAALGYAERAYRAASDSPAAADTWGWMLFQNGRADEALEPLENALVAVPGNAEISYHMAAALQALGRSADALRYLDQALSGPSDFPGRDDAEALRKTLVN